MTLENLGKTDSSKSWEGLDTGEMSCYWITSHPFTNSQGSPLIKRRDIFLRKLQSSTEEEEPKNQGWWWDLRIWIKQGNELYFAKYWGFHNDDLNYSGNNIIERYRTIWRSKNWKVWSTFVNCQLVNMFAPIENCLHLDSVYNAFNFLTRFILKTFSYQGLFRRAGQKQILSVNPSCLYFELTRNVALQTFK